jgi:hypothetical protein
MNPGTGGNGNEACGTIATPAKMSAAATAAAIARCESRGRCAASEAPESVPRSGAAPDARASACDIGHYRTAGGDR